MWNSWLAQEKLKWKLEKNDVSHESGSAFVSLMSDYLSIQSFLSRRQSFSVIDVRSPLEFSRGHIPGAINIPLFDDKERADVGTIYKKSGKNKAILQGLKYTGEKLQELASNILPLVRENQVFIYCWRGGMRSGSMGWLVSLFNVNCFLLERGYKEFRRFVLEVLSRKFLFQVIGGKTGSGKSDILKELKKRGEQVIDLESLANHKGSAFGYILKQQQPTQEQFENMLAIELNNFDISKKIWIEDESRMIGRVAVPKLIWEEIRNSKVFFMDLPVEARIDYLLSQYTDLDHSQLIDSLNSISKRLGGNRTKMAEKELAEGNLAEFCKIILEYYDSAYEYGLSKREQSSIQYVKGLNVDPHNVDFFLKQGI